MFPSRNDWTIKLHAVVKFLFFVHYYPRKENVSVALPTEILASEGFFVNKQSRKLPSPQCYCCLKLREKKLMIVVLLHKYIVTKNFH